MRRRLRLLLSGIVGILVALLTFGITFVSPVGQPTLEIDAASTASGFSQVFFADSDQLFSEERSTWAPVRTGPNVLAFGMRPWRNTSGSTLRWDPLDAPADMKVSSIVLKSLFERIQIPLESITPSMSVSQVIVKDGQAEFVLESNDSQTLLDIHTDDLVSTSFRMAIVLSLIGGAIAGVLLWLLLGSRRSSQLQTRMDTRPITSTVVHLPLWVGVLLGLLLAWGLGILILGSQEIGVSWDEPIHELSLVEYFRSGIFVPRGGFVAGAASVAELTVYAPVGALLAHALGVASGVHAWAGTLATPEAWASRHLMTAAIAIVGIGATVLIGRIILRTWRWGLLTGAVLVSIPLFLGHGMFNIKDVPVATGFTLLSLGLLLLVEGAVRPNHAAWATASMSVGLVLAMGNRPGIWVAALLSAVGTLGATFVLDIRNSSLPSANRQLVIRCSIVVGSSLLAMTILWIIYPAAFADLPSLLTNSLQSSQAFPWSGQTLTNGEYLPAQPPWTYVPTWFAAQLPILIGSSALLGLLASGWMYWRAAARQNTDLHIARAFAPLSLQTLAVPIAAVAFGATLYGGVRQLLFVFPTIAVFASIGVWVFIFWISRFTSRWLLPAAWGLVTAGLFAPMVSQTLLFPFNFAYFNVVAASGGINGKWDVDGWWLSGRELAQTETISTSVVCEDSKVRPIVDCARLGVIAPYLTPNWSNPYLGDTGSYTVLRRDGMKLTTDKCTSVTRVARPLFFQDVLLSETAKCTVNLEEYPTTGITFGSAERSDSAQLWGWNPYLFGGWSSTDGNGVWTVLPNATLAFTLSDRDIAPSGPTSIELSGIFDNPDGIQGTMKISLNGVDLGEIPMAPSDGSQTWSFAFPRGSLQPSRKNRVVLTFSGLGPQPWNEFAESSPPRFRLDSLVVVP